MNESIGTLVLHCVIPLAPMGKARPIVTRNGTYMPKLYKDWVAAAVLHIRPLQAGLVADDEPVSSRIEAIHKRPKRLTLREDGGTCSVARYPGPARQPCPRARPDLDNTIGSVWDACTRAGVWGDDCQVTDSSESKRYAAVGEDAHVVVTVRRLV